MSRAPLIQGIIAGSNSVYISITIWPSVCEDFLLFFTRREEREHKSFYGTKGVNDVEQTNSQSDWRSFASLLKKTEPPLALFLLALLLSLLQTGASLLIPWFTKDLINQVTGSGIVWGTVVVLGAVFIVNLLASGFSIYITSYIGQRIVANLRKLIWEKLLSLPIPFYDQTRSGEMISRITNDTTIIMNVISSQAIALLTSLISVVGSIFVLLYLDWQMTLMMLLSIPLTFLVVIPAGKKMRRISKKTQEKMAGMTSFLSQVLSEIRLVKAYGMEKREQGQGERDIEKLFGFGLKEAKVQAVLGPVMSVTITGMMVLIVGFGALRVADGILGAGELVAFILYLFQIVLPLGQIAQFVTMVQKARGATERVANILNETAESYQRELPYSPSPCSVQFQNVFFAYKKEDVLRDISFVIPPGKTTAIVGPSGSGKTTIFSLLERFYEPTRGFIKVDNQPLSTYDLRDWRRAIGYVSQENPILAGTIYENIAYGVDADVSADEVIRAAKIANAHDFIDQLPQGYNTEVGERGLRLSGGQRQRIAIARAFLRDPIYLLLDEATSNLDAESERAVQQGLDQLMKGRTTVVIAHRLSTVVDADQIIVLEQGRVTGVGSHEELLATHSLYRKLVEEQFRAAASLEALYRA